MTKSYRMRILYGYMAHVKNKFYDGSEPSEISRQRRLLVSERFKYSEGRCPERELTDYLLRPIPGSERPLRRRQWRAHLFLRRDCHGRLGGPGDCSAHSRRWGLHRWEFAVLALHTAHSLLRWVSSVTCQIAARGINAESQL